MGLFSSSLSFNWFNFLLLICFAVITVCIVFIFLRVNKLKNDYKRLMKEIGNGEDVNEIFNKCRKELEAVSRETEKLKTKTDSLEKNMEKCVQKVGVVRYNAYGNANSDLCFAVALLDFENNGVVINGIYSRDNTTTTYAKPIEHGKSKYTLVKEEEEAIEIAKHNGYKCFLEMD